MNKLKQLWQALPDWAKRVVHTFYQAFIGVFLLGITNVLANLLQTGDWSAALSALLALATAALAAAISAVKAALVARWGQRS